MTVRIKMCGIARERDAHAAVAAGADALGFVFHAPSPRAVTPLQAMAIVRHLPPFVARVGVFVNAPADRIAAVRAQVGLTAVQLHGDETPAYANALAGPVIRAFRGAVSLDEVHRYQTGGYLLDGDAGDRYGGAGVAADGDAARSLAGDPRFVLAGGLTPENVGGKILQYRPAMVDVSSGVETAPGTKCPEKMRAFIAAVRTAAAQTPGLAAA